MDLQELSQWMKDRNLKGHWEHSEWSQTVKPFLWKGDEIMQALNWSGELITTGEAGRRTIQMRNPGLAAGMTNTVHISVQLVKPGEVAAAHRHLVAEDARQGRHHDASVGVHEAEVFQEQEQRDHGHLGGDDERAQQHLEDAIAAGEPQLGERVAGRGDRSSGVVDGHAVRGWQGGG